MNTFKSLFMAFCAAAILSSCSGENKTADNDNTAEEATDSTVGGNLTADTTTSMMEADTAGGMMMGGPSGKSAQATISSASGSGLTGVATFTEEGGGVKLVLTVEKATPGPHAVHLHQNGDCSKPDATSAGPHWNPTKQEHGNREAGAHHQGDMPNMEVGQDGKGRLELTVSDWAIGGTDTTRNVVNKAIIVHAKADDYKSQPAGNAGDRIGCGVVTLK
jgi:superoxide dismutase, Cu-Zn family